MHVVVTGGTSGIGRALVHHHARHGHQVTAIGRDAARGEALRAAGNVRFLRADLSHRIAAPLTVNVAGPGAPVGSVTWDDLQLRDAYSLTRAAMQASRANDLLGASLADREGTRYVLYNPGEGLSAYRVARRIDTRSGTFVKHFDPAAAARLRRATAELVPSGT